MFEFLREWKWRLYRLVYKEPSDDELRAKLKEVLAKGNIANAEIAMHVPGQAAPAAPPQVCVVRYFAEQTGKWVEFCSSEANTPGLCTALGRSWGGEGNLFDGPCPPTSRKIISQ